MSVVILVVSSQHPGAQGKDAKYTYLTLSFVATKPCVFWLNNSYLQKVILFGKVILVRKHPLEFSQNLEARHFLGEKRQFLLQSPQSENLPTKMSFLASSHFNNTELVLGTYKHLFKFPSKDYRIYHINTPCCFPPPQKRGGMFFGPPVNGHFMALLTR